MTVEIDGDFVVFLIGARFDKLHLVRSLADPGGRRGMKHMLDYLVARPEKGLLAAAGATTSSGAIRAESIRQVTSRRRPR